MMRAPVWIGVSLAVGLIVGAATGGWYLYQHHLSDDVKRLLVAANDEHASQAETRQYVTQVRPLVRTKRDRDVFQQFETALALLDRYQEDQREDEEEIGRNERAPAATDLANDECYAALRDLWKVAPSAELMNETHRDLELGKECVERRRRLAFEARIAREKRNLELAFKYMNGVRKAVGLPPLPDFK